MTGNFLSYNKRLILGLLIFIGLSGNIVFSQESLSGNINQPHSHVVTINADRVTVDDATGFSANDTILMIQMQGVTINIDPGFYGGFIGILGVPGLHEFLIVQSVNTGINEIIFRNNIINSYNLLGNIQVVRVPYYNSATVTGKLSCDPWDPGTKSGGVLAMIIGRTLKLNADIDVSDLGFTGGKDTIGVGICLMDNQPLFGLEYYPWSFTNAGYKGEGVANFTQYSQPLIPNYTKGLGPNWNGGGGGNGRYSGGGGGANGGKGGTGGYEDQSICGAPWIGGSGGNQAVHPSLPDRIFFGGGGGASTTSPTGSSSQGGNGGGIVIIVADTLMGNGGNIIANGEKGGSDTGLGGSGGGGAGGSIALYIKSYGSSPMKFSAQGGNGGDNPGNFGDGGGGGGGLLFISSALTGNVADSLEGGKAGNYPASTASDGIIGEKRPNFMAVLNGFLYNSIRSSVTGDQVDSICSNVPPPKITGTAPVGGTMPYTYKWEKSSDAAFTTPIVLTNDADPTNYTPTVTEAATVWFRRIITDSSLPTAMVDTSKAVQIIVQPQILNNLIVADPDTICFGSDPQIIRQGIPDLVVPSATYLKYIWQDSIIGGAWGIALAPETEKEYDPNPTGGLTVKTWYRRTVISGRCKDKTAIDSIEILPKLTNNAFSQLFDTICFGGNTNLNTIAGLTGGLSTDYRYKWEQSNTGSAGTWTAIVGETNNVFDPDASVSLPVGDHFYRRIIFSGEQDACKDTTPRAARKVWPIITTNVIQADQTIGYDSIPLKLVQTVVPAGGAGISTYKYSWIKDTLGLPSAPGPNPTNQSDYQPPNLKWTVSFRRIINSSACTNTSNPVMITVDSLIINTISLGNAALDTIYTGQVSSQVNGSQPAGGSAADGYSFKWYKSTAALPGTNAWTEVTGIETQYDPGILTQSTWFRRDVSSPAVNPRATTQSNYVRVTVLPSLVNVNISANQAVCSGSRPLRLNGNVALAGGDGKYRFTWQDSTSGHDWQDIVSFVKVDSANYKPLALTSDAGYRRIVYSGKNDCGVEVSNIVKITVNPLPGTPDAGPDQGISSIGLTAKMNATPPLIGETGMWEVLEPNSATTDNISDYNTIVRNLALGANYFLWTVTTDIGNCKLSDSVRIILSKDFEPSAFSPNGDGINDQFVIEGLNLTEPNSAELTIVNSSGTEVFSTSNFNGETWTDWNGKNSKGVDLSEGTYYYLLKVITKDPGDNKDRVDKRKGFIILKRR